MATADDLDAAATPLQVQAEEPATGVQTVTEDAEQEPELGDVQPHEAYGHEQGADFGTSAEYGERLNYEKKKCRNPICFVLYYLHVLALIGCTIWLCAYLIPDYLDSKVDPNQPNNNLIRPSPFQQPFNHSHSQFFTPPNDLMLAAESPDPSMDDFEFTGIAVAIIVAACCGLIFGLLWLKVLNCCAGPIIKLMLVLNIMVWLALFIAGCIYVNWWLIICSAIFCVVFTLWAFCVWDRVKFAVVLMGVASDIVSSYTGVVFLSLGVMALDIVWIFLWTTCAYAYFWYIVEANIKFSFWIFIFLLISLFWGLTVNRNISHTTTCGVAATWYFSSGVNFMPTFPAFWRTMTTSFGSIALGSFFVGILEAVRSMFKWCENNRYSCIRCIVSCWLRCIEWMMIYFNKYAYAHVAIYGSGFIHAAKATWVLFMNKGLMAVVNDDLTGAAITCGSIVCGVIAGGVGYGIGYAFYGDQFEDDWGKYGFLSCLAILCGIVGLIIAEICLHPLPSAVQSVFVCFAEEPEILAENRPKAYKALTESNFKAEPTVAQNSYPAAKGH